MKISTLPRTGSLDVKKPHSDPAGGPSRPDDFAQWSRAVVDLRQRRSSGTVEFVRHDLDLAFEELVVAEEELRTQHEEVLATRSALEQERMMYQRLFESAPVSYVITNSLGTIVAANVAASAMLGVRGDRLKGKPLAVFIEGSERQRFRQDFYRALASEDATRAFHATVRGRDGTARKVQCVVGVLRGRDGPVQEVRWMLIDQSAAAASERDEMVAAADAARFAAEQADLAKTQLLAAVSHELRTPLSAVGGYAELLSMGLRGPLTDAQAEDVRRIWRAQEHMTALLDDLLLYFRLGVGGLRADVSRVALADIASGLLSFVAPQANQRRVSIDQGRIDPAVLVFADADRARQVLINLLTNAVKFSPADSAVRMDVECDSDRVRVRVTDRGSGMTPDQVESIFKPFVQLPRAESRAGFGLGLALSRRLAEAMGGALTVESTPGQGSTFILELRRAGQP